MAWVFRILVFLTWVSILEAADCPNGVRSSLDSFQCKCEGPLCTICLYPYNCLSDDTCVEGSEGPTCERCSPLNDDNSQGYFRWGSRCVNCQFVDWTTIFAPLYFILVIPLGIYLGGWNVSTTTKLKQLIYFLQLYILSFTIRCPWSQFLQQTNAVLTFINFSAVFSSLTCFFNLTIKYVILEMAILPILLIFFLGIIYFYDRSLVQKSARQENRDHKTVTILRRTMMVIGVLFYGPVAGTCLRTWSCAQREEDKFLAFNETEVYLHDQSLDCADWNFQCVSLFSTVVLVFYLVLAPILIIFCTAVWKKWKELDEKIQVYGALYESYKNRACFWEAVPALRILAMVAIIDIIPVLPLHQTAGNLAVSICYLVFVVGFRPYKQFGYPGKLEFISILNIFEVISNLTIIFIQTLGLLLVISVYQDWLDITAVSLAGTTILIWTIMFLCTRFEITSYPRKVGPTSEITLHNVDKTKSVISEVESGTSKYRKLFSIGTKIAR